MATSRSSDPRRVPDAPGAASAAAADTVGAPDTSCDVVTVPARQGLEAVDILRRGAGDAVGPVLHDGGGTLGFLVPPGTAAAWDVPGSTCTETDARGLRLAPEPPVGGSVGLLPPGVDPRRGRAVGRAAVDEAWRLIVAGDSWR